MTDAGPVLRRTLAGRGAARTSLLALVTLLTPGALFAGPPFVTDDPEPVEFRHFEIYLASVTSRDFGGW